MLCWAESTAHIVCYNLVLWHTSPSWTSEEQCPERMQLKCAAMTGMCGCGLEEAVQQGSEGESAHLVCRPQLQEDQVVLAARAA